MPLVSTIARLFRIDDASHIDRIGVSFGAGWAHTNPLLVVIGCVSLAALSYWLYFQRQNLRQMWQKQTLCVLRSLILCVIFVVLADPDLELTYRRDAKPDLWIMIDQSESMSIRDRLTDEQRLQLETAVGWSDYNSSDGRGVRFRHRSSDTSAVTSNEPPSRIDYAAAFLSRSERNLLDRLEKNFELRLFGFGEPNRVQSLASIETLDRATTTIDLATDDRSTAIGDALHELTQKYGTDRLAAALVISDFNQNAGGAPVTAAKKMGLPLFTVGVGPVSAVDLSIELQVPAAIKRGESATATVTVRQQQIEEATVRVRLFLHPLGQTGSETHKTQLGDKPLVVNGESTAIDFTFVPESSGRHMLTVEVDAVPGEVITQNNRTERETKVIDDFLRLLFVEHEPTWEWRFIKEVFHRDKLVGARGFRTYLKSADPIVRETNELFLPTLTMPRKQFFENDILFLGDLPAGSLNQRFCEMTKEFVGQFGGGLVVIVGPRFGTAALLETPLSDLLPVVLDTDNHRRDSDEFLPVISPLASQFDFMRLGMKDNDQASGWTQLGKLPWYQPVRRIEVRGTTVLAEHPTDTTADGVTKQPLIAIRKYGRGEVVWIGFNELWRLRRLHGEEYYRQFWGQLIHRLGLSHALGHHKRFVVQTDKTEYRLNEQATITTEAYDDDFQPLDESKLPQGRLSVELELPSKSSSTEQSTRPVFVPQRKPGQFETQIPLTMLGPHQIRVTDPISKERTEISLDVIDRSIERQIPDRNLLLQRNLASETGGRTYELTDLDQFPDDFQPTRTEETRVELISLWSHWAVFGLVLILLTCEWVARKRFNLI